MMMIEKKQKFIEFINNQYEKIYKYLLWKFAQLKSYFFSLNFHEIEKKKLSKGQVLFVWRLFITKIFSHNAKKDSEKRKISLPNNNFEGSFVCFSTFKCLLTCLIFLSFPLSSLLHLTTFSVWDSERKSYRLNLNKHQLSFLW